MKMASKHMKMASKLFFTTFKPHHLSKNHYKPFSLSPIKMSSSNNNKQNMIEHLVLFKTKPNTNSSSIDSMTNNLNNLKSLHTVLHISSGPINLKSSPISFTHILHSRYKTIDDLNDYSAHPEHVSVVAEFVKPICDDIMAVDWVTELDGPVEIFPGKGIRINLVKLKEGLGESEKNEILRVIGGIKGKFKGVEELSFGENFSHARAKGYSIASIAVVNGVEELEKMDSIEANEGKFREFIESVIVLDYLVPNVQNSSL